MPVARPREGIEAWRPLGATLLAIAAAGLAFCVPGAPELLQYDRSLILQGQVWRVATSHWTHWTAMHLFWDMLAFCTLLFLAIRISPRRTAWLLLLTSMLIPAALWIGQTGLTHYRGLSGLDSALFVFVALAMHRRFRRGRDSLGSLWTGLLLLGFVLKVGYEFTTGQAVFVTNMGPGVVAVPLAHAIGTAIGAACQIWHFPSCPAARFVSNCPSCHQPPAGRIE